MKIDNLTNAEMQAIIQTLVNMIDIGIHVVNKDGKTIIYNKKMADIEEMDPSNVHGKNILELFKFNNETESTLISALRGNATKKSKQTYFTHNGQEITTINDTCPLYDSTKQICGAIEVAKDITNLERIIRDNILKKGDTKFTFDHIIGKSIKIAEVIEASKRATRTSSSILIVGETGTGKELFAQSIHNGSKRSSYPFISQNCAAIPESLIEGILFGTKKGAFTGSIERPGLFEQAEGGTLLLDEINSLNPTLQAKLLRALQEKTIRRVGDTKDKKIDVRVIATINEDPIDAIANGHLRKDLFYRLSVVSLFIPPLRERKDDTQILAQSFLKKFNHIFDMNVKSISKHVLALFEAYDWPGNVRELEHIIEGAMNLMEPEEAIIDVPHLPVPFKQKATELLDPAVYDENQFYEKDKVESKELLTLEDYMTNREKEYLEKILKEHDYNISQAAKTLQMSRQRLQYRLRKFKLK